MAAKELDLEELEKVTGGDNNDYKKEWAANSWEVKYLYNIDQWVEVYKTGAHIGTKRRQVKDRRPMSYKGGWVGEYKFIIGQNWDGSDQEEWIMADDIES